MAYSNRGIGYSRLGRSLINLGVSMQDAREREARLQRQVELEQALDALGQRHPAHSKEYVQEADKMIQRRYAEAQAGRPWLYRHRYRAQMAEDRFRLSMAARDRHSKAVNQFAATRAERLSAEAQRASQNAPEDAGDIRAQLLGGIEGFEGVDLTLKAKLLEVAETSFDLQYDDTKQDLLDRHIRDLTSEVQRTQERGGDTVKTAVEFLQDLQSKNLLPDEISSRLDAFDPETRKALEPAVGETSLYTVEDLEIQRAAGVMQQMDEQIGVGVAQAPSPELGKAAVYETARLYTDELASPLPEVDEAIQESVQEDLTEWTRELSDSSSLLDADGRAALAEFEQTGDMDALLNFVMEASNQANLGTERQAELVGDVRRAEQLKEDKTLLLQARTGLIRTGATVRRSLDDSMQTDNYAGLGESHEALIDESFEKWLENVPPHIAEVMQVEIENSKQQARSAAHGLRQRALNQIAIDNWKQATDIVTGAIAGNQMELEDGLRQLNDMDTPFTPGNKAAAIEALRPRLERASFRAKASEWAANPEDLSVGSTGGSPDGRTPVAAGFTGPVRALMEALFVGTEEGNPYGLDEEIVQLKGEQIHMPGFATWETSRDGIDMASWKVLQDMYGDELDEDLKSGNFSKVKKVYDFFSQVSPQVAETYTAESFFEHVATRNSAIPAFAVSGQYASLSMTERMQMLDRAEMKTAEESQAVVAARAKEDMQARGQLVIDMSEGRATLADIPPDTEPAFLSSLYAAHADSTVAGAKMRSFLETVNAPGQSVMPGKDFIEGFETWFQRTQGPQHLEQLDAEYVQQDFMPKVMASRMMPDGAARTLFDMTHSADPQRANFAREILSTIQQYRPAAISGQTLLNSPRMASHIAAYRKYLDWGYDAVTIQETLQRFNDPAALDKEEAFQKKFETLLAANADLLDVNKNVADVTGVNTYWMWQPDLAQIMDGEAQTQFDLDWKFQLAEAVRATPDPERAREIASTAMQSMWGQSPVGRPTIMRFPPAAVGIDANPATQGYEHLDTQVRNRYGLGELDEYELRSDNQTRYDRSYYVQILDETTGSSFTPRDERGEPVRISFDATAEDNVRTADLTNWRAALINAKRAGDELQFNALAENPPEGSLDREVQTILGMF